MDATTETTEIVRELSIAASPETVWELLVDPGKVTRWMGERAAFDARPGGAYHLAVVPGHTARGEFVEVDRPHRLVFTFGWEDGSSEVEPGTTTVEFELEPQGEGTLLRFTHSGLPSRETAASHAEGWDHYLARLGVTAGGGDPGRDPWLDRDRS
ncbi:MAG TPA: SRPBCC family protein [Gaiellaceae bacterium]|nr:SRPBCC family protein [Gaiellaceae bacterium]